MLIICLGGPKKNSSSFGLRAENLEGREVNVKSLWLKLCAGNPLLRRGCSWGAPILFTVSCWFGTRIDWSLSKLFTIAGLLNLFNSRIGLKASFTSSNLVVLCLSCCTSTLGAGRLKFGRGTATWTLNPFKFCLLSAFWSFSWTNSLILPSRMDKSLWAGLKSDSGCDLFSEMFNNYKNTNIKGWDCGCYSYGRKDNQSSGQSLDLNVVKLLNMNSPLETVYLEGPRIGWSWSEIDTGIVLALCR